MNNQGYKLPDIQNMDIHFFFELMEDDEKHEKKEVSIDAVF